MRDHSYGNGSYYHDVVVANQVRAYQGDYMFLQDKLTDFDAFIEKPIYMNYPNFLLSHAKFDYYTKLRHAQDLFVSFVNVLARLYILTTLVNIFVKKLCMTQFTFLEQI